MDKMFSEITREAEFNPTIDNLAKLGMAYLRVKSSKVVLELVDANDNSLIIGPFDGALIFSLADIIYAKILDELIEVCSKRENDSYYIFRTWSADPSIHLLDFENYILEMDEAFLSNGNYNDRIRYVNVNPL